MKIKSFAYQYELLVRAYECLKDWFDPSQEGSPYEASVPTYQPQTTKRSIVFKKRMSIRF